MTELKEEKKKLRQTLSIEQVKKVEAINKLAQVMYSRPPTRGGGHQPSQSRRQDREIRKLRGELQHETQKFQNMVKKYQRELEEVAMVRGEGGRMCECGRVNGEGEGVMEIM